MIVYMAEFTYFRKLLLHHRGRVNLSQSQLGDMVGLKQSYIQRIEKGQNVPTTEHAAAFARALQVDVQLILDAISADKMPGYRLIPVTDEAGLWVSFPLAEWRRLAAFVQSKGWASPAALVHHAVSDFLNRSDG